MSIFPMAPRAVRNARTGHTAESSEWRRLESQELLSEAEITFAMEEDGLNAKRLDELAEHTLLNQNSVY